LNILKEIFKIETNNLKTQISEFITTSNSGSCFLSWYRGTWKTSLISSAIKMAQKQIIESKEYWKYLEKFRL
jgi:hypothetical protein